MEVGPASEYSESSYPASGFARRSDEASQVDWRPLDENLGQRASIFALGGTQPIDFAFAAVALPTAIRFDRSWASRYALTLPCLKAYPKGFLRLARAIASAHQAPFFPATSHAAKTQIPPAYAAGPGRRPPPEARNRHRAAAAEADSTDRSGGHVLRISFEFRPVQPCERKLTSKRAGF